MLVTKCLYVTPTPTVCLPVCLSSSKKESSFFCVLVTNSFLHAADTMQIRSCPAACDQSC